MLCTQRVVSIVLEEVLQPLPFLADAHCCLCDKSPFLRGRKQYAAATITLYLSHLGAKADAGQFEAEGPNQPRRIIRVFGRKITHCPQTVLSRKQALSTPPVPL